MAKDPEELRLLHFGRAFGLPDASPFCVKAESYLRLLGVDYTLKRGNPQKSPRKQLPVLLHRSEVIAGSGHIIDYLRGLFGTHIDDWMTEEQRVQAYHLVHSVEDYLYFILVYQRWVLPQNFKVVTKNFFPGLNPWLKFLIARLVRRGAKTRAIAHGVGRHSHQEMDDLAYQGVEMMAASLGDKDFFFGSQPCWADCSMYGFVCNLLVSEFPEGVGLRMKDFPSLIAYEKRFRARVFPELVVDE